MLFLDSIGIGIILFLLQGVNQLYTSIKQHQRALFNCILTIT